MPSAVTQALPPIEADMPALIDKIITNDDDESTAIPNPISIEVIPSNDEGEIEPANSTKGVEQAKTSGDEEDDEGEKKCLGKFCGCLLKFYWTNEFLILILLAILLALPYPKLGAIYLAPQITATWIAVMFIFLLAGLGLKTEEFKKASQQCSFNLFIFAFNFGVDSAFIFGVSRFLKHYSLINEDLANGMVITASLPLTINMCVVLTKMSGGDEAAAIINTSMWNMVGVFLSPVLILAYIGETGSVNRWKVFYKLGIRVILPIVIGQLLKWFVPAVANFVQEYKPYFKKAQMYSLVFIVYTIFCRTFINPENRVPVKDVFIMIAFIGVSLIILMVLAWYLLQLFFRKEIKLRIMGLYGCTHKTAAMGIPLINAIYEGNPAIGLYTLPLLIWHPMQLVFGTIVAPRLLEWSQSFEDTDDLALEVEDGEAPKAKAPKPQGEVADTDSSKIWTSKIWKSSFFKSAEFPSDEYSVVSKEIEA